MADTKRFLAMDLGAESGRGMLMTLSDGKVTLEQVHRWPNRPVRLGGQLHWDFPYLFAEMLDAMRACSRRGVELSGIGVDTWGVDFGLLGRDGKLVGLPVHYRDRRTEGIHEYSDPILSRQEIFAATGYEPWAISSLFQLLAMKRADSPLPAAADRLLNIPDLFNYFLCGVKASERSIANHTNVMGTDGQWRREIIERFELPAIFGDLIEPGTVLGPLTEEVRRATGLGEVPVIAVNGHDTSSVVAAVPAVGDDWAFLSCGTWSIVGSLVDQPITTPQCLARGFTNQYAMGRWYIARNILGLWLVQELRRKWDTPDDPWDYVRMTAEAEMADSPALFNVADESLLAPADMEAALQKVIAAAGQPAPATRGQLVRCVLESLALEYKHRLDSLAELTGKAYDALYMVGGGIANKLLCQLTADACGIEVQAGANECTAMGNALCQALAVGALADAEQIRHVVRESVEMTTYHPRNQDLWREKRQTYGQVT
jgi:rhamnulokinase